jgi:Skp family chaperone for outer membrane proteins
MTSRERALVYFSLIGLGVLNLCFLFGSLDRKALAGSTVQDGGLGPAGSLTLTGEPAIELRNRDGRLSWSESPHGRAYSIAFVDVNRAVERLLETPQYQDEREDLTTRIETERAEWLSKQQAIREKYQGITPDDPRAEQAQAEFAEWQAGAQQWDAEMQESVNSMAVEQLEQGYREVIEAVEVVSAREAIDLVFRFTPPGDPLPADLSGQTMLDIRMRTVVKHPEGLDITPSVLEELGLTVE